MSEFGTLLRMVKTPFRKYELNSTAKNIERRTDEVLKQIYSHYYYHTLWFTLQVPTFILSLLSKAVGVCSFLGACVV